VIRRDPLPLLALACINLVIHLAIAAIHLPVSPSTAQLPGLALSFLMDPILQAAAITAVLDRLGGATPGLGRSLANGFRFWWRMLVLNLAIGLGVGFGTLLLVIPGVLLGLRWAVAAPVLVAEADGISNALVRSASLTRGHRWAILGLGALAIIVLGVLLGLGSAAALLLMHGENLSIFQAIVGVPQFLITYTIYAAIYTELRRIKDGAPAEALAAVFS
jgi:hypothetical protein